MFSKIIQVLLVLTSVSPVLLTFWFKSFSQSWKLTDGLVFLFLGIILISILKLILYTAKIKLEVLPISITEVSNADQESLVFIFTYLIPLLNIDTAMIIFLLILFFIIIFNTSIYHFNPILGLLGYHQYEIKIEGGLTFILVTKKTLRNTKQIKNVVQLTDYILLEKEI